MTADTKWNARRRRAIQSVFQTDISQPTPYSTPSIRFPDQGQAFGGPLAQTPRKLAAAGGGAESHFFLASPENAAPAAQQTRFDRSWHVVTSRIALPASVTVEDSFGALPSSQDIDEGAFRDALRDVLDPADRLPLAAHTDDILAWHTQQVRLHFVSHVLPLLGICDGYSDQTQALLGSIRTLEAAHRQYLFGLSLILRAMREEDAERSATKFRRDLHALVGNSMSDALIDALRSVLSQQMKTVLGVKASSDAFGYQKEATRNPEEVERARKELHQLVESLSKIGFAGERFQILFAELLDEIMIAYIREKFAGKWEPNDDLKMRSRMGNRVRIQPECVKELTDWVEDQYARLAVEVTSRLDSNLSVSWAEVGKWKEIATGRLAALRIDELFDIVISWPDSEGGIDDLRYAITTPQRRLQLTDAFSSTLQKRLLHAGRSTLDILRTYIAMIRTFHILDHSRVLLDRVAYSLQLYLCTREDTVRIIVAGLLTNQEEVNTEARKTKLVELVELLMQDSDQYRSERQDEEWDDLDWVPAPVDAGSNYRRRKSEDVIGTLIGALGSPEVFIKEFQSIIGERLLSEQAGFQQEVGVLDLLKKRFGEASLQACDVMIKDIQDSQRLDHVIQKGPVNRPNEATRESWMHARILSRLYWPEIGEERFLLPSSVTQMQKTYETTFEHLKPSRKMKWLNHLGQATVELEFEDGRAISERVHTYEAAVIDAFSEENSSSWSFDDLWMKLEMDEDLLTAALSFWEKKQVLRRLPDNTYVVIEHLSETEQSSSLQGIQPITAAVDAGPATPRKAKTGMSEKEKEKRQVYWQFVVGMLTNSGPAMPLGQIAMMMKMLIADGFPWSNEELQEFLGEKIADGELEIVGGKYKLIKK